MVSTVTLIPAAPEEVAERLDTKMRIIHQTLFLKGEYLSDSAVCGRVCWVSSGSGHKLIIRTEDLSIPNTNNLPLSPVDSVSSPHPGNSGDTEPSSPSRSPTPSPTPIVPATLAMVVQIEPGQSWLYPDGKWTGPTHFVRRFTDVKLLCTGSAPSHMRFHSDYKTSTTNLNRLMDEVRTTGNPTIGVISGPDGYVKVCHSLFTVS